MLAKGDERQPSPGNLLAGNPLRELRFDAEGRVLARRENEIAVWDLASLDTRNSSLAGSIVAALPRESRPRVIEIRAVAH